MRPGVSELLIAAGMVGCLWGCAELVRPIEPGTALTESPGHGLVFGRIAVIRDDEDQFSALPSFPKEFGWVLTQAGSGKRYVVSPLTQNGVFVLELATGSYEVSKLMYDERAGLWEGRLPARFSVQSSGLNYVGTWAIEFTNLGPSSKIVGKVVNQLDEARDDLMQTYRWKQPPVTVSLLESAQEGYLSLVRPRAEQ